MAKKDYPTKYNYDAAIELILKAAESDGKVTYEELEKAYGLEKPIADKSASSTNMSALYELRQVLKAKHGLTFKSASDASHYGPEYHYYIVSKVKDTTITKKKSEKKEKPSVAEKTQISYEELKFNYDSLKKSYDALEKEDVEIYQEKERLYQENRDLRYKNEELLHDIAKLNEEINKYKDAVRSLLHTTVDLSALVNLKHQF